MSRAPQFPAQPVGAPVPNWTPRRLPPETPMPGRFCRVERLDSGRHAADLFAADTTAPDRRAWTYLLADPPGNLAAYAAWLDSVAHLADPFFHAIVGTATQRAIGLAAYLRIDAAHGTIEIGHINFSPLLQRTPAGTEAIFLLLQRAFSELGYRRAEWKCDALNAPSRRAALRYGFTFEGIFRQALVTKGRNRDTAWYAIIDTEWPALHARFQAWLHPDNFVDGVQQRALADLP